MALNENVEAFIIHIALLSLIHSAKKTQIALLLTKEVIISAKYSIFSNIFIDKKALILLEITKLNQYTIKLQTGQQPLYRLINSLKLVKLKMMKT